MGGSSAFHVCSCVAYRRDICHAGDKVLSTDASCPLCAGRLCHCSIYAAPPPPDQGEMITAEGIFRWEDKNNNQVIDRGDAVVIVMSIKVEGFAGDGQT